MPLMPLSCRLPLNNFWNSRVLKTSGLVINWPRSDHSPRSRTARNQKKFLRLKHTDVHNLRPRGAIIGLYVFGNETLRWVQGPNSSIEQTFCDQPWVESTPDDYWDKKRFSLELHEEPYLLQLILVSQYSDTVWRISFYFKTPLTKCIFN